MLCPSPWYGSGIAIWSNSREPLATKQIGNSCMSCCKRRHRNNITIHKQKHVTQFFWSWTTLQATPSHESLWNAFPYLSFSGSVAFLRCFQNLSPRMKSLAAASSWQSPTLNLQIELQIFSKNTHIMGNSQKGSKPDLNRFKAILKVDFRTKQPGAWVRSVEVPIDGPNRSVGLPKA